MADICEQGLERGRANHEPLTPLAFRRKTAAVYPDQPADVYRGLRRGWPDTWARSPTPDLVARLKARQGVANMALVALMVAHPDTMVPVPEDGATLGEVFMRGNCVMQGYLKNPSATEAAFRGGWCASGDLAVRHPDGYVEIKDRSKDIIISGGKTISSIAVEDLLYRHPPSWKPRSWRGPTRHGARRPAPSSP